MQSALCTKQNLRPPAYRGIPTTNIVLHDEGRSRSTLKNCSRRRRATKAPRRRALFMQGAKLASLLGCSSTGLSSVPAR